MATLAGAERDMEGFVKGLFQGSPDLSTLTHAIVRKKYLVHVGKESLTKEEKDQLKRLIEKELVQLQIDDSGDEELLTKLKPSAESGSQKRILCISDSSGDEAESKHERKKRRTVKQLELSSDEEDSGIDSKKARVCRGRKPAGISSSSSDHGGSGAEGHADAPGSEEESVKNKAPPPSRRTGRETRGTPSSKGRQGRGERSGSGSEESNGGQGSDVEEEASKTRKAAEAQAEESESSSENDLKGVQLQKKKGTDRGEEGPGRVEKTECRKKDNHSGERETESEEESGLSETREKKRTSWSDSEEEKARGDGCQAKIMRGPRGRKARERSWSEDKSNSASRAKQKTQPKVTGSRHRKQDASMGESESDSGDTEVKGQVKKGVRNGRSQRPGAEKLQADSDSEEREALQKKVKNPRMKKAQGGGVSRKELEGNQKRRTPIKRQAGPKAKRSVSRKESGSETEEGKSKKGTWNSSGSEDESQSEAEQRGKGKKQSEKIALSRYDSESGSEETAGVNQRQKRVSEERNTNKEVSGSESSQGGEEPKKKGAAKKSQQRSVGHAESESDSEDSGSESAGKVKNRSQPGKGRRKAKGRTQSKEEPRSESDKEDERSSSGDEDGGTRSSKQQRQGKDKEHRSAKGEDHPSVQRLKRYIRECGVRRNYKKLLMGCRSRKAQLEVLKQELENLGLKGTPSLAKCKALKKKLEEAAEVASLDVGNIIATEGRPRRRNVWSLYSKPEEPPSSPEESPIRRPATDWSRLRGVISSDDESD